MRKTKQMLTGTAVLLCLLLSACSGGAAENAEEEAVTAAAQAQEVINTASPVPDMPEDEQADPAGSGARFEMTLTEEERRYWENEYAAVLNQYYAALTEGWSEEDFDGTLASEHCLNEDLDSVGYTFIDLDSDGAYELLTGYIDTQDGGTGFIFSQYALEDYNPAVGCYSRIGDDRNRRCYLCEGNIIKSEDTYSDGSFICDIVDYPNDKDRTLYYDTAYRDGGYDSPWSYKTKTMSFMKSYTDEEARDFLDEYDALMPVEIDFIPISQYTVTDVSIDDIGHLYRSEDDTWITDDSGNITASKKNGDFDEVLAFGDGYYMLYKDLSGFDEAVYEVGIMKYDGTWPIEYAPDANLVGTVVLLGGDLIQTSCVHYVGQGVFLYYDMNTAKAENLQSILSADIHVFLSLTGEAYTLPQIIYYNSGEDYQLEEYLSEALTISEYVYLHEQDTSRCIVIDILTSEILGALNHTLYFDIGEYSDGGFVYGYNPLYFFDCSTRESTVISLEDADKFAGGSYQFVDGEMEIRLSGADGNTYYATVDKSGNYITEPHLEN